MFNIFQRNTALYDIIDKELLTDTNSAFTPICEFPSQKMMYQLLSQHDVGCKFLLAWMKECPSLFAASGEDLFFKKYAQSAFQNLCSNAHGLEFLWKLIDNNINILEDACPLMLSWTVSNSEHMFLSHVLAENSQYGHELLYLYLTYEPHAINLLSMQMIEGGTLNPGGRMKENLRMSKTGEKILELYWEHNQSNGAFFSF